MSTLPKVEIVEEGEKYNCPDCENELENINIGSKQEVLIQHCSKCDGIFIKEKILKQIIEKQTVDKKKFDHLMLRFIQNNPRHAVEKSVKYKKCPVCTKIMQRYNYGAISGVILDKCPYQHGIWLDSGELKQIIEWKYHGGVAKETSSSKSTNMTEESYENTIKFYSAAANLDRKREKENQRVRRDRYGYYDDNISIFDIVRDISNFFKKIK